MFPSLCQVFGTVCTITAALIFGRKAEVTLLEFPVCFGVCFFRSKQQTQGRAMQHCTQAVNGSCEFSITYRDKIKTCAQFYALNKWTALFVAAGTTRVEISILCWWGRLWTVKWCHLRKIEYLLHAAFVSLSIGILVRMAEKMPLPVLWNCLCLWRIFSMNYLWYFIVNGVLCSVFVNNEFFMTGHLYLCSVDPVLQNWFSKYVSW